jgi:hypothetical protein
VSWGTLLGGGPVEVVGDQGGEFVRGGQANTEILGLGSLGPRAVSGDDEGGLLGDAGGRAAAGLFDDSFI